MEFVNDSRESLQEIADKLIELYVYSKGLLDNEKIPLYVFDTVKEAIRIKIHELSKTLNDTFEYIRTREFPISIYAKDIILIAKTIYDKIPLCDEYLEKLIGYYTNGFAFIGPPMEISIGDDEISFGDDSDSYISTSASDYDSEYDCDCDDCYPKRKRKRRTVDEQNKRDAYLWDQTVAVITETTADGIKTRQKFHKR